MYLSDGRLLLERFADPNPSIRLGLTDKLAHIIWSLVTGYWLLVTGYCCWLLVSPSIDQVAPGMHGSFGPEHVTSRSRGRLDLTVKQ